MDPAPRRNIPCSTPHARQKPAARQFPRWRWRWREGEGGREREGEGGAGAGVPERFERTFAPEQPWGCGHVRRAPGCRGQASSNVSVQQRRPICSSLETVGTTEMSMTGAYRWCPHWRVAPQTCLASLPPWEALRRARQRSGTRPWTRCPSRSQPRSQAWSRSP